MPTFEEFHVMLNLNNYFWFEDVHYSKKYKLFYLDVTSKATGEIIEIPLTDKQFDLLLEEMEQNYRRLYCIYYDIPILYRNGKIMNNIGDR
jgi:hypothetical protein